MCRSQSLPFLAAAVRIKTPTKTIGVPDRRQCVHVCAGGTSTGSSSSFQQSQDIGCVTSRIQTQGNGRGARTGIWLGWQCRVVEPHHHHAAAATAMIHVCSDHDAANINGMVVVGQDWCSALFFDRQGELVGCCTSARPVGAIASFRKSLQRLADQTQKQEEEC